MKEKRDYVLIEKQGNNATSILLYLNYEEVKGMIKGPKYYKKYGPVFIKFDDIEEIRTHEAGNDKQQITIILKDK